jgi:hypothetical protein
MTITPSLPNSKSLSVITHEAIQVLIEQVGAANTVRFLEQFTTGNGNYTDTRQQLLEGVSLEDILRAVENQRQSTPRL